MIKFPENVKKIAKILSDAGFCAYAVGGCVRDSVLGRTPGDWDITTSARPDEMLAIFESAGIRTIPTGLKHGTVSVLLDGMTYECTTFRIDGDYTDSRHPDNVTFTANIADDLSRRDFTVNAMAARPTDDESCEIIDLFGGCEDIDNKIIRCVGDPEKRFEEDALRMLRAVRFAAVLGFEIQENTKKAAAKMRDGLAFVSAERKKVELEKTLLCDNADYGISLLFELGLAKFIHKDIKMPCVPLASLPKSFSCRVAALFGADADPSLASLKLSRLEEKQIKLTCAHGQYSNEQTDRNARRLLSRLGDCAEGAALLRGNSDLSQLINIERSKKPCIKITDLAIDGNDVISKGIPPRHVGTVMNTLLELVIDDPSLNTRQTLLSRASDIYETV